MSRRRSIRPPDLTSLFDVLFLFVFVSLVNAGVTRREADNAIAAAAAATAKPAPHPPARADLIGLRDRAVHSLASRSEVAVRVTRDGQLAQLELADRTLRSGTPLVERVADPDVGVAYLGERNPDLRVCAIVARALGTDDLRGYLVIIAPAAPLGQLAHALVDGLRADVDRCAAQRGVAVIVDPDTL